MEILTINILLFLIGLALLIISSDWLIQSCVKLSSLLKLSPLFIGIILVAFGTSAPEAGVGIVAAIKNQKEIALGNIVGSNISNIGLILGGCALITPLKINSRSIFKRELPIMLFATVLLFGLSLDLVIDRLDGALFILCFAIFCVLSYKGARIYFHEEEIKTFGYKKIIQAINSRFMLLLLTFIFLLGLVWGADLMVKGGVTLAKIFGVSPWVVGLTVFAIGTSLPELVTSLTASLKKVPSISVGNIVGSNIFNILFVLGIVALIRPIKVSSSILGFEFPVLVSFSFLLLVVMRTGYEITRKEGVIMFFGYIIFLFFLFFK